MPTLHGDAGTTHEAWSVLAAVSAASSVVAPRRPPPKAPDRVWRPSDRSSSRPSSGLGCPRASKTWSVLGRGRRRTARAERLRVTEIRLRFFEVFDPPRLRPAFVPRTTGRRQETTGAAGASKPQVRRRIRASPLVAKSGSRTLSRWRHGIRSRWDYQGKRRSRRAVSTPCKVQTRVRGHGKDAGHEFLRAARPIPRPAFVPQRTVRRHDLSARSSIRGPKQARAQAPDQWAATIPPHRFRRSHFPTGWGGFDPCREHGERLGSLSDLSPEPHVATMSPSIPASWCPGTEQKNSYFPGTAVSEDNTRVPGSAATWNPKAGIVMS